MSMRPVTVRMAAAGFSRWVLLDHYTTGFGVGIGLVFSDGATLECTVQHTFDDIYKETLCPLVRTTTSLNVNFPNHGLSVDDWVQLADTEWAGQYAVATVVDANNFTVTVADSGSAAANPARVQTARTFDHDALTNIAANADGNYQFPPQASRLLVTAWTDGFVDFNLVSGG